MLLAGLAALSACGRAEKEAAAANAQAAAAAAPHSELIGLPNGATISVEPGSVGQQLATYLASSDPAPRSFQIGGDQFEDWSATARPAVRAMVPGLVELLKSYPQVKLRIIGHTDNVGTAEANLKLSSDRAETAKRHLVEAGISESRIEVDGKGLTQPIGDNATLTGRASNRRIELVVIAK
jgi:outer membrane protein OmpA-like peptidoglycan-associated protein